MNRLHALRLTLSLVASSLSAAAKEEARRPRVDVVFALDTTGSMGDEIDVVKQKIVDIARRLQAGQPRPDVRYGIVAFRDRGDEYVTRAFPFERDIEKVRATLAGLFADGGGDEPEDVASALHVAVREMSWDRGRDTAKLVFLVGDAGPQRYRNGKRWEDAVGQARERGIQVSVVACSGLGLDGERVFKQIAERTGGDYRVLTYSAVVAGADGRERRVLRAGDRVYTEREDAPLSADEWKKGAESLLAEGKLIEAPSDALVGPGTKTAAGAGAGWAVPAIAAAAPVPAEMTNNLDEEIAAGIEKAVKR